MNEPRVVSRRQWVAARSSLLAVEEELARARDALTLARRTLPAVRIDTAYRFAGPGGETTLPALFDGRRQLIVVHLMYAPGWDAPCPGCALLADGIGDLAPLHARDTTLVAVSRAPFGELAACRRRRGWSFPWYSSFGGTFDADFQVLRGGREVSGVSVFLRSGADVLHTYSTYGRGVEPLLGAYTWLDLTPLGRQDGRDAPARDRAQGCRTAAM
jgi:predicted dithiol-disulfide oxidoreductase (DUF899 family)